MRRAVIILGSIASAVLYRLGGSSRGNKLFRRLGCSLLTSCLIGLLWGWNWLLLVHMGLLWGFLSTYFDSVPWNKGRDSHWMHGLGCGLAALPVAFYTGDWLAWGIRAVVLAVTMGLWSKWIKHDVVEELGRGVLLILTLIIPLFL